MTTATIAPTARRLVTGEDPDEPYPIPSEARFKSNPARRKPDLDFVAAPDVARIADALIDEHRRFRHLVNLRVTYLWKRTGGASSGAAVLGKCVKASGLAKYFGDVDYVIWLGADNCRALALSRYQVEALTYHELLHTATDEADKPLLVPHDAECFVAEIEQYGLWMRSLDLVGTAAAHAQLRLPLPDPLAEVARAGDALAAMRAGAARAGLSLRLTVPDDAEDRP